MATLLACVTLAHEVPHGLRTVISSAVVMPCCLSAVDLDGDGRLDLLAGCSGDATISWYRNLGGGTFASPSLIASDAQGVAAVRAGDLDGDGDPDVVSADSDSRVRWFENLQGTFATGQEVGDVDGAAHAWLGDLDQDGDLDILAAGWQALLWFENLGPGSFNRHPIGDATASALFTTDLDGDGDVDLLVSSTDDDVTLAWYENDSGGQSFTERVIGQDSEPLQSVSVADIDGDGDLDLLAAAAGAGVTLLVNDGSQDFSGRATTLSSTASVVNSLHAIDLDGDGDLDVGGGAYGTDLDSGDTTCEACGLLWWENHGSSGFAERVISAPSTLVAAIAIADLDNDGDLDTASTERTASGDAIAWYENLTIHGSAAFSEEQAVSQGWISAWAVDAADLDGDGDPDLLAGLEMDGEERLSWYANLSHGAIFSPEQVIAPLADAGRAHEVHVADLDRDGLADAIVVTDLGFLAWYQNLGGGAFAAQPRQVRSPSQTMESSAVASDLDADGDIDLLFCDGHGVMWYENGGNGDFAPQPQTVPATDRFFLAQSVAATDVDSDGDQDVVVAWTDHDLITWHANDGDGIFVAEHEIPVSLSASWIDAADLDGDGKTDLLVGSYLDDQIAWTRNLGRGQYGTTMYSVATTTAGVKGIAAVDLDRDGDLDVLAFLAGDGIVWYPNLESAVFWGDAVSVSEIVARDICSADVDQNGTPDLVSGRIGRIAWHPNRGGQLALTATATAPGTMLQGTRDDLLAINASHRGRYGDGDAELTAIGLLLERNAGTPLATFQANALIDSLHLYRDDGSGAFEDAADTLVTTIDTLQLSLGTQTVTFADDDPNVAITVGAPAIFFVVVQLSAGAAGQDPNTFQITHLSGASSGEDRDHDIALVLEHSDDVSSGPVMAVTEDFVTQYRALQILYQETGGAQWHRSDNWLGPEGTECAWQGVTCDGSNRIVGLSLSANNLVGTIPTEIGALINLQDLALFNNHLTGEIPAELGNLSRLETLKLGSNRLSGEIPAALGSLANLVELDLHNNLLDGQIPAELGDVGQLEDLLLGSNRLTGTIPPELGNLSELQHLALYLNELEGSIPVQLGQLGNLRSLFLHSNRLFGPVPAELGNLHHLERLHLSSNRLQGEIPAALGNLTALQELNLQGNQLAGELPLSLLNLLTLRPNLLDLRWNALGVSDATLERFVNARQLGGDFGGSQTLAPDDVAALPMGTSSVLVIWSPITYTANHGGYRVRLATDPGQPGDVAVQVADKTASSLLVENLSPGPDYYFRVESFTDPHASNQGTATSAPSAAASSAVAAQGSPGVVALSSARYSAGESESKSVTVRRLEGVSGVVQVDYRTADTEGPDRARAGQDYDATSGTLVWDSADASPKTITIEIARDDRWEGTERLRLLLSNARGATLGEPSEAVISISDSDFHGLDEAQAASGGSQPASAAGGDGKRVVVWVEAGRDGSGSGIFGQRFDTEGRADGARFEVSSTTEGDQVAPAVACDSSGGFLAAWISTPSATGNRKLGGDVHAQLFGADGAPVGGEIVLGSGASVRVAARRDRRRFVIVVENETEKRSAEADAADGIRVVFLGETGQREGEVVVDDGSSGEVSQPDIAISDTGMTMVVWQRSAEGGWDDVYALCIDSDRVPVQGEQRVNTDTWRHQAAAAIAVLPDGRFLVAWHGPSWPDAEGERAAGSDVFGRLFSATGSPLGAAFRINAYEGDTQRQPVLAITPEGDCWAAWLNEDSRGRTALFGRLLPACSTAGAGPERQLNDAGDGCSLRSATITAVGDGVLFVTYVKDDVVEGDGGVWGRDFGKGLSPRRPSGRVEP